MKYSAVQLLAALLLFGACHGKKEIQEQTDSIPVVTISKEDMKRMDIRTNTIQKGSINTIIRGTGKICVTPNGKAIVSSNISGKVMRIFAIEGQYVKKGQPIFSYSSFELIELQQNYLIAKNDANFLKLEYERQKELRAKNIGSLADFQSIESKYFNAISTKESIGEKLLLIGIDPSRLTEDKDKFISNSIDIVSPIDGFLFKLSVTMGQRIEPNAELAEIIDLSSMYAEVNVYEKDIDLLHEKQEVFVDFVNESLPHQMGYISSISRSIDPVSHSIKVYVKFDKITSANILPGMAIKTEIKTIRPTKEKNFIVPLSGLLQEGELYYIFPIKKQSETDCQFTKLKVTIGENDGENAEIHVSEQLPDSLSIVSQNVYLVNNELMK